MEPLETLVKRRKEKLAVSRQAQREKMVKEVAAERKSRLESIALEVQLAKELQMANVAGLDADIAAKKKELGRLTGDIAGQRLELNLIESELRDRQRLKEKLAKEAVDQARRKGVPEVTAFPAARTGWLSACSTWRSSLGSDCSGE